MAKKMTYFSPLFFFFNREKKKNDYSTVRRYPQFGDPDPIGFMDPIDGHGPDSRSLGCAIDDNVEGKFGVVSCLLLLYPPPRTMEY